MSELGQQHEPWAIRLAGDEATRGAGDNLREWAGDDRSPVRRFIDRVREKDDKDPKLSGVIGEELVGKELAKLDAAWTVIHGVRVGPRADVDHLVIGPAGIFCLNTKRIDFDADVVVAPRQLRVNGYSRDYYPKAVKEASRVEVRLQAATGLELPVQPVLVLCGVDKSRVRIKEQPADVAVVLRRYLVRWLRDRPSTLGQHQAQLVARKARHPSTWDPSQRDEILDLIPAPRTEPAEPVTPPPVEQTVNATTLVRWRRYGHNRLYVNDAASGQRLGWRDEKTGQVHVDDGVPVERIHAALRNASPTSGTPSG